MAIAGRANGARLRVQDQMDAVLPEYGAQSLGHVDVLVRQERVPSLDHGHSASEAAEHLAELDGHVSTTDDEQMLWDGVQLQDGGGGEEGHVRKTGQFGNGRAATYVDEDALSVDEKGVPVRRTQLEPMGSDKARLGLEQVEVLGGHQATFAAVAPSLDDGAYALPDLLHIDCHVACDDPVVGAAAGEGGHPSGSGHGLAGSTALIDARAADVSPLDERRAPSRPGEASGKRNPCLTGSDDGCIICAGLVHGRFPSVVAV